MTESMRCLLRKFDVLHNGPSNEYTRCSITDCLPKVPNPCWVALAPYARTSGRLRGSHAHRSATGRTPRSREFGSPFARCEGACVARHSYSGQVPPLQLRAPGSGVCVYDLSIGQSGLVKPPGMAVEEWMGVRLCAPWIRRFGEGRAGVQFVAEDSDH